MTKLDVAITFLKINGFGEFMIAGEKDKAWSCAQAIRILEAAAKIDKEKAVKYMSTIGVGGYETDGESTYYPPDRQAVSIRDLLAALPDPEEGK